MVCKIDHRILVADSVISKAQLVILRERDLHGELQISRETFLSIRVGNAQQRTLGSLFQLPGPKMVSTPAVQRIGPLVSRKRVAFSAEGETRSADPVGISANKCAKAAVSRVLPFAVIAQHDVTRLPLPVRHEDGLYRAAGLQQRDLVTMGILKRQHSFSLS